MTLRGRGQEYDSFKSGRVGSPLRLGWLLTDPEQIYREVMTDKP